MIIGATAILVWQFSFPHLSFAATQSTVTTNFQSRKELFTSQWMSPAYQSSRLPESHDRPQPTAKKTLFLTVTAYSSTVDQCDGDPFTTASGTQVRDGIIAANFLPIGTKVRFPDHYGNKIFVVEDRTNPRYWQHADIWMNTREAAKQWGARYVKMEVL